MLLHIRDLQVVGDVISMKYWQRAADWASALVPFPVATFTAHGNRP
jgi:hypothetical protein